MSSTTFKSATGVDSELDVRANDCGVFIALSRGGQIRQASTFAASDAPALALAILEAAGYREERKRGWDVLNSADENIAQAMRYLSKGIEIQERATAEAKELAELESEALELRNAFSLAIGGASIDSFAGHSVNKPGWIDAARRAREMRNEKKVTTDD